MTCPLRKAYSWGGNSLPQMSHKNVIILAIRFSIKARIHPMGFPFHLFKRSMRQEFDMLPIEFVFFEPIFQLRPLVAELRTHGGVRLFSYEQFRLLSAETVILMFGFLHVHSTSITLQSIGHGFMPM